MPRQGVVALIVAVACAVVLMLPAPLPGHVVSSNDTVRAFPPYAGLGGRQFRNPDLTDPAQVFRPDLRWARQIVRSGHLPTWDPLVYSGWPLLASQQAAPLFPVSALSYVLPYEASIAWRILALLVLAMCGAWLFGRALGMRQVPAALTGIAFGLSAPLIDFSSHPQLDVYALLPWLMLGTDRVAHGIRGGTPLFATSMGLAALGGHPQSLVVIAPLVVAWALLRLITCAPGAAEVGRRAAILAGAAGLGLAAAAVVLLPLAELLGVASQTERGGFVGARLSALATLALPDVWGRASWAAAYSNPPGLLNYVERTVYVGALPVLVAGAGLIVRRDAVRWFFAAAGACSVVLAFDMPGISSWLVKQWPLRLAAMGRATVVLAFCLAVLGGLGLAAILDASPRMRRRAALAAGIIALLPLVWVFVRFHPMGGHAGALGLVPGARAPASGDEAVAAATARWIAAAGTGVGLLALLAIRPSWTPALAVAAIALVALDLAVGQRGLIPVLPTDAARLEKTPAIEALVREQGDDRGSGGAMVGGSVPLVPNVGETLGLRDPRGRGVPAVRRTLDAWVAAGGFGSTNFAFLDPFAPRAHVAMGVFGVRAVLTAAGAPAPPGVYGRPSYSGRDGRVWRVRAPLPRAFVACSWRAINDRAAATALLGAATKAQDLRHEPVVERVAPPSRSCSAPPRPARIVRDNPTRVDVDVTRSQGGRLVLLDTEYPGWEARVDGRSVPIAATNVAFRSVALPADARRVSFTYRPASVRAGLWISVLAWLAIAGLGVAALIGRRARRPSGLRNAGSGGSR